jgi:hypothetical protein
MPAQEIAHDPNLPQVVTRSYLLPVLATISAMSIMAAASATIGVWRDVSVIKQALSSAVKNSETIKGEQDKIQETLQDHEIRLTKGGL